MKVKGMTVQRLTSILQSYCHEGGSLDEVEIYDKEGNRVGSIEDIELRKGLDAEVCKITIHTRDIFDIEDYLKEEKESQPREDYDNFYPRWCRDRDQFRKFYVREYYDRKECSLLWQAHRRDLQSFSHLRHPWG